jgi:peroxiredoxin
MSSGRDDYAKFEAADAELVGISANVSFSPKAFADLLKLNYPLLSDFPDLKTIQAYGVLISGAQARTALILHRR